jgi:hypothetical protein
VVVEADDTPTDVAVAVAVAVGHPQKNNKAYLCI